MTRTPSALDLLGPDGLQAPLRHREVTEDVIGEQALRHVPGLDEGDELADGSWRGCQHDRGVEGGHWVVTPASMFPPTTAMDCWSSSVGLKSTTSVLSPGRGR